MSAIAIIPARGGSTRIPMKNIRMFHGRPIMEYSIETAKASNLFEQIWVSTDNQQIAEVAFGRGACVLWRPTGLGDNEVGTQAIASHVLNMFNSSITHACCIYATAPLMIKEDLLAGMALLRNNEAQHDYVMAVGAEPLRDAGQWYMGTALAFRDNRPLISPRTVMMPIPEERVCDINTLEDFEEARGKYTEAFHGGTHTQGTRAKLPPLDGKVVGYEAHIKWDHGAEIKKGEMTL